LGEAESAATLREAAPSICAPPKIVQSHLSSSNSKGISMLAKTILFSASALLFFSQVEKPTFRLPQSHYDHNESDPAWLQTVVQFHGHLGPSIVAGARLGMAGVRAAEAKGYFDVEVTCEGPFDKPPQSCFLDGLQVGTGATLGKRNLQHLNAKEIVIRVKNTSTGKIAEVRPTAKLLEMLGMLQAQAKMQVEEKTKEAERQHAEMERIEAIARKIAELPEEELAAVTLK
jgi:formylmethanofuran dehydrogenase subunit E